jgi:hypothetical protein
VLRRRDGRPHLPRRPPPPRRHNSHACASVSARTDRAAATRGTASSTTRRRGAARTGRHRRDAITRTSSTEKGQEHGRGAWTRGMDARHGRRRILPWMAWTTPGEGAGVKVRGADRDALVEVVLDVVGRAHGVGPVEVEQVRRPTQHRLPHPSPSPAAQSCTRKCTSATRGEGTGHGT